ncbi:VirB4 family type IV secretion system protein [Halalkalicoccus jeotgali]|uniref:Transfer complex protein, putative n=1 Tax=Halalkalicoccus jeotgali (strain DSM 18796 / CECT 7217 / JCM 14584 / KCTC 4019 / B3) TaxID=795797 RepID=D8JCS0_HALJB|nr:transfer complex protein [Halalkalicoccus jeotgali]ADJ16815.1 transfer complex protein, putative [Halalkalicoccus jeotgali B3]ADJ17209.1 transfer complex protein, putative [Halalkalicoccus jeotgali B3]ELY41656.1 transfer complex protein, putative [Halalkalicoccus jeotgali B3]
MADTNDIRGEQTREKDPTQLSLPDIDASIPIVSRFTLDDILFLAPAFGVTAFGGVLVALGAPLAVMIPTTIIGLVAGLGGAGVVLLTHEYTSPSERLTEWRRYLGMRRQMPVSDTVAERFDHHGVRRIFDDGTAEMDDGTLVGLVRVDPRTTANMTYGELDSLVATLSRNIDQRVKDFDFSYYSTTRDHDLEETIGTYNERAYSGVLDRAAGYMGEFMRGVVEWFEEVDEPAEDPREMHHYVTTCVAPDDVHVRDSDDDSGFQRRKAQQREMYDRLDTLESKMFAGVTGVATECVSAEEHAEVLLAYWTGEQHEPDERLERKFNRSEDGPSVWPDARLFKAGDEESGTVDDLGSEAARDRLQTGLSQDREEFVGSDMALAGSHFDAKKSYVEVGEQYAATLWIADYPTDIESNFLKPLYAMDRVDGVDLDITIDATAVDKKQAQEELQDGEANINAKSGEQSRIESRGTREGGNVYEDAGELLRNTNAQAWDISMYVTVRAGPRAALGLAESEHRDFDSWDAAKMGALQEGIADVKEILESSPVEATVLRPSRMQRELFASCSPNKGNVFNDVLSDDSDPGMVERRLSTLLGDAGTSGPKQKRVLGGFLGAAFPPCTATINEDGGLNWGRDVETGLPFRTNPAERGSSPHMITLGITRSGKTYGASSAASAWYAESDDRTLIVCDTQGGFTGLTQMLGGEHIVIEGDKTINPLDVQAPPEGNQDIDAYRMSVDLATNFFKSILESQGVDASEYHTIIEDGIERTYRDHGISPGNVESDENPTVSDLLTTWEDMGENPGDYTVSSADSESDVREDRAAELLAKLSGFSENGKYHNLLGETSLGLIDTDVSMAYLDLSQFNSDTDAEESAMMSLAQSQVTQKIRRTEGEVMFLIDEAHQLLHNDAQVSWLQKQFREVARYDAIMWLMSQHPSEFVSSNSSDSNADKKQALLDQTSFKQIYNMPMSTTETEEAIREMVPNEAIVDTIKNDLTPARANAGYTEFVCGVTDNDIPGWHRVRAEASPLEDYVLNYDADDHGEFDRYMSRFLNGSALAPVEQQFHEEDEQSGELEDEDTADAIAASPLTEMYANAEADD